MKLIKIANQTPHLVFLYGWDKDIRLEPRAFPNSSFEIESVEELIEPSILRAVRNGMIRLEMIDISSNPEPDSAPEEEEEDDSPIPE